MMTMRQKIAGKSPEQIRKIKRSELEAPVSMTDLGAAMEKTRRTVTQVRWSYPPTDSNRYGGRS